MSVDDSKIEQLKKKLYSNSQNLPPTHRGKLHPHADMVKSSWDTPVDETYPKIDVDPLKADYTESVEKQYSGISSSVLKRLGIFAGIFLVVAFAIAAYVFYNGSNFISSNNIDIKLLGPVSTPAGDELSLDVGITNKNNSDIVLADLVVTYPDGTRQSDMVTPMTSGRVPIGTIKAGQTVQQTVKSVLFGQENEQKIIKVSLEYRVPNSDTLFVKEKDYPIFIGTSPVTLTVDSLKEVTANEDTTLTVHLVSNSTSIVHGVVLKAEYPFGFQFESADIKPIANSDTWTLGDIAPGDERAITIKGKMVGEDNQQRIFKFYAGTESPQDQTAIGTIFVNSTVAMNIAKPFLGADITLDGSGDPVYVAQAGNAVKGEITYQNNLDVPINDVSIEAKLTGDILDKSSIQADSGFYKSSADTILWDKSTLSDLSQVAGGDNGRIQFSFASVQPYKNFNSTARRPVFNLQLTLHGSRLSQDRVPEAITSTISRQIKIATDLTMLPQLVRSIGPFQNTGPIPAKADSATTYTTLVSVFNSFNTVKDATYTATIPTYVQWLDKVSPAGITYTYNANTHQVTFNLGQIEAGTGYSSAVKQFAYQVSFVPSISQVSTAPTIIDQQSIAGTDTFTNTLVGQSTNPLNTELTADPTYMYGDDKVVQ